MRGWFGNKQQHGLASKGIRSRGIVKIKGKDYELKEPIGQDEESMRKTIHNISEFVENEIEKLRDDENPRNQQYNSGKWEAYQKISMLLDEEGYYFRDR